MLNAALLAEGDADFGLLGVLERLCVCMGFSVEIEWTKERLALWEPGKALSDLLDAVATLQPGVALIPVVPIHESEAWLLTSEADIRAVVGNPTGRAALDLPKHRDIEVTKSPKERLREALRRAKKRVPSKLTNREFGDYRARLFENLDINGDVSGLRAWQTLVSDMSHTLAEVRTTKLLEAPH